MTSNADSLLNMARANLSYAMKEIGRRKVLQFEKVVLEVTDAKFLLSSKTETLEFLDGVAFSSRAAKEAATTCLASAPKLRRLKVARGLLEPKAFSLLCLTSPASTTISELHFQNVLFDHKLSLHLSVAFRNSPSLEYVTLFLKPRNDSADLQASDSALIFSALKNVRKLALNTNETSIKSIYCLAKAIGTEGGPMEVLRAHITASYGGSLVVRRGLWHLLLSDLVKNRKLRTLWVARQVPTAYYKNDTEVNYILYLISILFKMKETYSFREHEI